MHRFLDRDKPNNMNRYLVERDLKTNALSVPELNVIVNLGTLKENIRRLRELVPLPAVLVYPHMGQNFEAGWYEISKESLTEARIGQEFREPNVDRSELDGMSDVDFGEEQEIPEPIDGWGKL